MASVCFVVFLLSRVLYMVVPSWLQAELAAERVDEFLESSSEGSVREEEAPDEP